jgi:hypothetical protein|tara:strand:+ start:504 stop:641 length:138 start_codon:yes stop_codon:yes gene_type:complete
MPAGGGGGGQGLFDVLEPAGHCPTGNIPIPTGEPLLHELQATKAA